MSFEKPFEGGDIEKEGARKASLVWGAGGHEREWILNLEGYNLDNYIPDDICDKLNDTLGEGFRADNRGSRIEILTPDGTPCYGEVVNAVNDVLELEQEEWGIDVDDEEEVNRHHQAFEGGVARRQEEARERMEKKLEEIRRKKKEEEESN